MTDYRSAESETDRLVDELPTPQWLASETRRIRRERCMTLAESILLGACLVIMVVMILIILGWIR